jgi:hypothetical protein
MHASIHVLEGLYTTVYLQKLFSDLCIYVQMHLCIAVNF